MTDDEILSYDFQEASFFALPFEHDESVESQERSVRIAEAITEKYKDKEAQFNYGQKLVKFAKDHKATIDKFGRYPHRNEVLERESSPEEIEYLKTAERYGQ